MNKKVVMIDPLSDPNSWKGGGNPPQTLTKEDIEDLVALLQGFKMWEGTVERLKKLRYA